MIILNLGCGTKTSPEPEIVNIDWSISLRIRHNRLLRAIAPLVIGGGRLMRFRQLPENIKIWNLSKGIPFESNSVDVVYHSHLLEHLDRSVADNFVLECKRVLKPGGIHRVVVPDLENLCRKYLSHISACEHNIDETDRHEKYVESIIEQSVRKEAYGTSQQHPFRRLVENLILGDARRRGETHQWMYDRISLKTKMLKSGYSDVYEQKFNTSRISNWAKYALDVDANGNQYKRDSLYMEAIK